MHWDNKNKMIDRYFGDKLFKIRVLLDFYKNYYISNNRSKFNKKVLKNLRKPVSSFRKTLSFYFKLCATFLRL